MGSLTSSATFTIGDAASVADEVSLLVLPAASAGEGTGRLIHPTLGTYDYEDPPNQWLNLLGDAIVPPVWASQLTLGGAANTLWPGYLRDVVIEERWLGAGASMLSLSQLEMLVAMWMNPPTPPDAYVEWWPSYATTLGYQVVILAVEVGGQQVLLDHVSLKQERVQYPVTLKMRIAGRAGEGS